MSLNIFTLWFPPNVDLTEYHLCRSSNYWSLNCLEYVYQHHADKVMHDSLADSV